MATEKSYLYPNQTSSATSTKEYNSSIAVQLPTTSANNDNSNQNRNQNQSNSNILNYCYHQAATRSLLLQQHQRHQQEQQHHHHHQRNLNHQPNNTGNHFNPTTIDNSDESNPTPPPHYYEIPGIVPAFKGRTSGPPPSYDDVVNPNAPPPSYQSLFGQVREARKTSNGFVDLLRQLFLILIGTLGCTMLIGFLLLIPITMIIVGIVYINDCQAENIPQFLVIGGFVWIMKNMLNCYNQFKKDSTTINRPPPRRTPISTATTSNTISNGSSRTSSTFSSTAITINSATTSSINSNSSDPSSQSSNSTNETQETNSNQTDALSTNSSSGSTTTTSSSLSSSATTTTASNTTTTTTTRLRSVHRDQQVNRIRQPALIGMNSFKCESLLNFFLVFWFLMGCIIVYRIYEPDYNPNSVAYCNRTVYLYAFWLMTSAFISMAIVLSCLCCLMASSLISCNHGR